MKLIDADALIGNAFKNDISYKAFVSLVKRQPTIDAVPARRGKWERNSARIAGWAKCSECGNMEPPLCTTHFCGHCGAEMEDFDETD